ncbi:MAG: PilW family protein [Burkholderiales bacterium]
MKNMHHPRLRRSQGLSLIELMVSITIGLILMIAVMSAYLGSSNASKMAEATGRMNEDAQSALSILSQQISMAGFNPKQPRYDVSTPRNSVYGYPINSSLTPSSTSTLYLGPLSYSVRGCDGTFSDITTATSINALTCAAGDNTDPDSIAITYEADIFNTVKTATTPFKATDCLGNALVTITNDPTVPVANVTTTRASTGAVATTSPTLVTYTVADNRFYVKKPTSLSAPSLYCKGNGGALGSTEQPLVENIENLQFYWGLATTPVPNPDNMTVAGYLDSANAVETDARLIALDPPTSPTPLGSPIANGTPTRWARVVAVKICVVVRSEQPIVSDTVSAQYFKCDGTLDTTQTDLRLRRAYTTVVALRNRVQQN